MSTDKQITELLEDIKYFLKCRFSVIKPSLPEDERYKGPTPEQELDLMRASARADENLFNDNEDLTNIEQILVRMHMVMTEGFGQLVTLLTETNRVLHENSGSSATSKDYVESRDKGINDGVYSFIRDCIDRGLPDFARNLEKKDDL